MIKMGVESEASKTVHLLAEKVFSISNLVDKIMEGKETRDMGTIRQIWYLLQHVRNVLGDQVQL